MMLKLLEPRGTERRIALPPHPRAPIPFLVGDNQRVTLCHKDCGEHLGLYDVMRLSGCRRQGMVYFAR